MVIRKLFVHSLALGFLTSSLFGCSGNVGNPKYPDGNGHSDPDQGEDGQVPVSEEVLPEGHAPAAERCEELRNTKAPALAAKLRRLSWQEIENSLADLFPETQVTELAARTRSFDIPSRTDADLEINESFVRAYRPTIATFTARAAQSLTTKGACTGAQLACLEAKLLNVARRAWRGLSDDDRSFLTAKTKAFMAEIGNAAGFAAALELVFASPRFLFLPDPGSLEIDKEQNGAFVASGERLAALWAAAVWSSVPDQQLLDAAADGKLDTDSGRGQELDRMLADARAKRGMAAFFRTWLRYNQITNTIKDQGMFPAFNDDVRAEMLADTESTLLKLVFDDNEAATALLNSPLGNPGPKTVALLDWAKHSVEAKAGNLKAVGRVGVATHPALLAITSSTSATSIVNRGRFVVEKLACAHVPEPPPNVDVDLAKLDEETGGKLTGRQLAERHAGDPACASCHKFMDPFGLVFENFDAIGRHRDVENGLPIDTSVELDDALGIKGKFSGAEALLKAVAETGLTERCFASSFAHFVKPVGLNESQACAITNLTSDGKSGSRSMLEVTRAFLLSTTFLTRSSATN